MAVIRVITNVLPALEIPIWNASNVTQISSYNSKHIALTRVQIGNLEMVTTDCVKIVQPHVLLVILSKCVQNVMTIIN